MVSLRGHHLICLHFYNGEGYEVDFVRHLSRVLHEVETGKVQVVEGPDDVCSCCPHLQQNRCALDEGADEQVCEMDEVALRLLRLRALDSIQWRVIKDQLPKILPLWASLFCKDCNWQRACLKSELYRRLITGYA